MGCETSLAKGIRSHAQARVMKAESSFCMPRHSSDGPVDGNYSDAKKQN